MFNLGLHSAFFLMGMVIGILLGLTYESKIGRLIIIFLLIVVGSLALIFPEDIIGFFVFTSYDIAKIVGIVMGFDVGRKIYYDAEEIINEF